MVATRRAKRAASSASKRTGYVFCLLLAAQYGLQPFLKVFIADGVNKVSLVLGTSWSNLARILAMQVFNEGRRGFWMVYAVVLTLLAVKLNMSLAHPVPSNWRAFCEQACCSQPQAPRQSQNKPKFRWELEREQSMQGGAFEDLGDGTVVGLYSHDVDVMYDSQEPHTDRQQPAPD